MNKFSDYLPWGVCGLAVIYRDRVMQRMLPGTRPI